MLKMFGENLEQNNGYNWDSLTFKNRMARSLGIN